MSIKTLPNPVALTQPVALRGYEQVVGFLSDQLREGTLKVGDRLLPERELATQLNMSRPVVREALRSLAMIGVLEVQQGRGTFVRSPDFATLSDIFTFMFAQDGDELDDIMELRQGIERQAIRLACMRARTNDFAKIGAALEEIHTTIDDPALGGKADFEFHTRIVEASHSAALIKVYTIISRILEGNHVVRRRRIAATGQLREYILDHHGLLFQAIQTRDAEACDRLLTEHFAIGEKLTNLSLGRAAPQVG